MAHTLAHTLSVACRSETGIFQRVETMAPISAADGPIAVTGAAGHIGSWVVRIH